MAFLKHLGGDRWKVAVYLGKNPDGTQRRPTRTFTASGKKDAAKKAAKLEAEIREAADRTVVTVAQAAEDWWPRWLERERSPSTVESYRIILDKHIAAAPFAQLAVEDVTTGTVERWYGSLRTNTEAPLSPARIRRIH